MLLVKKPIRDLHSARPTPPRFCDVVIDGEQIYLEQKKQGRFEKILWADVVYQVEAARATEPTTTAK